MCVTSLGLPKRIQIVGARLAGASATKTSKPLNPSRGTVSTVMTAYTKYGKDIITVNLIKLKLRQETIRVLYESIPRRIEAVLKAHGGPTPY